MGGVLWPSTSLPYVIGEIVYSTSGDNTCTVSTDPRRRPLAGARHDNVNKPGLLVLGGPCGLEKNRVFYVWLSKVPCLYDVSGPKVDVG